MKDIISKYKRHKIISNLGIVTTSLILALAINFFVIGGTDMGKNLRASILNSEANEKSDIFLEKSGETIFIKNSKKMNNPDSVSFSLVYNPDNVEIINIRGTEGLILTQLTNTEGFSTIFIDALPSIDIYAFETLASFNVIKKQNKTETINLINANFSDSSSEIYELTTSGITF